MPGFRPLRVRAEPPPLSAVAAMSRSGFYPGGRPVTVCETHTAWVFLAGDRAYKVKKPVRMAFLDFSTLEQRRRACLEELRVNRELAPEIVRRVCALVPLAHSYVLSDADAPGAVEYAVEMRRFDEGRTMAALAQRGALTDAHVRAVARRLAAFHAAAPVAKPPDPVGDVQRACDRNLGELLELADNPTARRMLAAAGRFTDAFLVFRGAEIAARAEVGRVRECHGDLRAEHVVLEEPIAIVDRLEFAARLRRIDVSDDLAFLAMDLEWLGACDAARLLVASYRAAGGNPGDDALLAFYGVHRALVRAKVSLLRAGQVQHRDAGAADVLCGRAGALLTLAERLAWRARGPFVLAVSGPPASGKSTLAAALARRSGLPVVSSDVVRKRCRGLAPTAKAPADEYTDEARAAVYRELGELAARDRGAIVDATFGDPALRRAFLDAGGDARRLRAVECRAPPRLREQRACARTPADARGSDATPDVAARLGASFSGWEELPAEAILTLPAGADVEALVDEVADWLDGTGSVVFRPTARRATDAGASPPN
jgi:aminoglycoside phosphotransferase family enzyme/predicted kinase